MFSNFQVDATNQKNSPIFNFETRKFPIDMCTLAGIAVQTAIWRMAKTFTPDQTLNEPFTCTSVQLLGFIRDVYVDLPDHLLYHGLLVLKSDAYRHNLGLKVNLAWDYNGNILEDTITFPKTSQKLRMSLGILNPYAFASLRTFLRNYFGDRDSFDKSSLGILFRDARLLWEEEVGGLPNDDFLEIWPSDDEVVFSPDSFKFPDALVQEWNAGKARNDNEERLIEKENVEFYQRSYREGNRDGYSMFFIDYDLWELTDFLLRVCSTYEEFEQAIERYQTIKSLDRRNFETALERYAESSVIPPDWLLHLGEYAEFLLETFTFTDPLDCPDPWREYEDFRALRYVLNRDAELAVFGDFLLHIENNQEVYIRPEAKQEILESYQRYLIYKNAKRQYQEAGTLSDDWVNLCGDCAPRALSLPWSKLYDLLRLGSLNEHFTRQDELESEVDYF